VPAGQVGVVGPAPAEPTVPDRAGAGPGYGPGAPAGDGTGQLPRRLDILTGRLPAGRAAGWPTGTAAASGVAAATAAAAARARGAGLAAGAAAPPPWQAQGPAAEWEPRRRAPGRRPAGSGHLRDLFGLGQVGCWQVALAMLAMSRGRATGVLVELCAGAVVLLALTTVRWHGRWLYQWAFALVAFGTRRRRYPVPPDRTPAEAMLAVAAPGARVGRLRLGDLEIGVLTHSGGAAVVLAVGPPVAAPLVGTTWATLPAPATLLPPADPTGPTVTCQLLVHTVPALGTGDHGASAAASYWELTANRVPAYQSAWVAVQVRRDIDHLADDVLHTTLANVTRRLLRRLRTEGQRLEPLAPREILPVVATVTGVTQLPPRPVPGGSAAGGPAAGRPPELVRERWRGWSAAGVPHTALRLRRLIGPATDEGRGLASALLSVPTEASTLSVATRRAGDLIEAEIVMDLTGHDREALRAVTRTLAAKAAKHGARLAPLDGYQRAAVPNVLPLGGFLEW
jgi:type VII secretion protein EccE